MSSISVVRAVCHPDEALLISELAATHPLHARHGWLGDAVHVTLDLAHVPAIDRDSYRQRVTSWLEHCRDAREAMTWDAWCVRKGIRP